MRHIIDETALGFTGAGSASEVNENLKSFLALLEELRSAERPVEIVSGWGNIVTTLGLDVASLLTSDIIERDERIRLLGFLGKASPWDDVADVAVDDDVAIDGEPYKSFGISFAVSILASQRAACVLTLDHTGHRDWREVQVGSDAPQTVYFLVDVADCHVPHRAVFGIEDVPEDRFFDVASQAFPNLRFASGLRFNRFVGGYSVRDDVVRHLGVLNDDFMGAYRDENGNSEAVSARIGIDVSIEGSTRQSEKNMSKRDIVFDEKTLRCEWHSKLRPEINRIHFFPGYQGESVVIGLFVDHLRT